MKSINEFLQAKENKEKISMVSTYEYWSAKICEEAGIDSILVGDSVGMVDAGYSSTLPVTLDEMIYHAKAVRKGAPNTFVVVDLPFLTYQVSPDEAVRNAGRVMKETGANAVKVEGGEEIVSAVEKIIKAGIPVMGYLLLLPSLSTP